MTLNEVYALSKKYTSDTAEEFGAVKGAPCTIKSIVDNGDGTHTITFEWKNSQGATLTDTLTISDGVDGETGPQGPQGPKGNPGEPGVTPEITVYESTSTSYRLKIKTGDDEYITPNLKGTGGVGINVRVEGDALYFYDL